MAKKWKLLHRTLQLKSKWVTVYADKLLDNDGNELEYWHYDRSDSVVVIAIHRNRFILTTPQYRVGVDEVMLDFAGSRINKGQSAKQAAIDVVQRELGVSEGDMENLETILEFPLAVDSSFSSQKLHGYICYIKDNAVLKSDVQAFPLTDSDKLRKLLRCGQCRLLLGEFMLKNTAKMPS